MTHTAEPLWENLFDPFSEELIASPYAQYDRLRSAAPVHWSPPLRTWVLSRMEDVQTILNDRNFVAVETSKIVAALASRAGRNYDGIVRALDAILFFNDGPTHQEDRRTLSKIVNQRPLSQLESVIGEFASFLISKLFAATEYDAIREFAEPLPQYVMADILGLPLSDVPVLGGLLAKLTLSFDVMTLDFYDELNGQVMAALNLLERRIEEAAAQKARSGLSIIYDGTSGPKKQRIEDAAATALFAFRVGAETTIGLIGLLIGTLIQRPQLYQTVRGDLSLAPALVSEVLRLESSVQRVVRVCRKSRVIGNETIKEGERVLLLLGAANRDPIAFTEPNALNLQRETGSDVAFGAGHHFCLGASLARLEGRIALEYFLRLPQVAAAGNEEWYAARSIRRLTRLPVRVMSRSDERRD
jgi:cytochrome P450